MPCEWGPPAVAIRSLEIAIDSICLSSSVSMPDSWVTIMKFPGSTVTKLRTVTPVRHRRGLSAAPRRVQAPAPVWGMVQAAPAQGDVVPAPATGRGPDPEMGPGRAVPGVQGSHVASGLSTPYGFQSVLNTVMRTQPRQQLVGIVDEPLAATAGTFGVLSQSRSSSGLRPGSPGPAPRSHSSSSSQSCHAHTASMCSITERL
jgi:hypothetical protein